MCCAIWMADMKPGFSYEHLVYNLAIKILSNSHCHSRFSSIFCYRHDAVKIVS